MRLLQVCNVGNIVGGTAACAWSVTRALPDFEQTICFRSPPTEATRQLFSPANILHRQRIEQKLFDEIDPEIVLLHNVPAQGVFWGEQVPSRRRLVVQYLHSRNRAAAGAHRLVACSGYLCEQLHLPPESVLHQGVPQPDCPSATDSRGLSSELIIGRLCTPTARKWPLWLPEFYASLSQQFPQIHWEFVGCPVEMQDVLRTAMTGQIQFYPADWSARSLLNRWHGLLYSQPEVQETFGRVVAEAMRSGCVPIVDAAGGFQEQIVPGTGFLCRQKADFVTALQQLSAPGEWWQRAQSCRETAHERFSLTSFRQRLLNCFEQGLL